MTNNKKVVILGGGYYGTIAARGLDGMPGVEVVLVDRREVFLHKIGMVRGSIVGGDWADLSLIPRDNLFKTPGNRVVFKNAVRVTEKSVEFDDGTSENFDTLVVATGAKNSSPAEAALTLRTKEEMLAHYNTVAGQLAKAKDIVIIGGGAVGIEYAGEIKSFYGDAKQVTLMTDRPRLLDSHTPAFPEHFTTRVKSDLEAIGVKVILNAEVVDPAFSTLEPILVGAMSVKTKTGLSIVADAVINATGMKHGNRELYPEKWLDAKTGLVKVEPTFLVEGTTNVFAYGDCTNVVEAKTVVAANMSSSTFLANLKSHVQGKEVKGKYNGNQYGMIVLPFGPSAGVGRLVFLTVGSFIVPRAKGRTLFIDKQSKEQGHALTKPIPTNWVETERKRLLEQAEAQ